MVWFVKNLLPKERHWQNITFDNQGKLLRSHNETSMNDWQVEGWHWQYGSGVDVKMLDFTGP